MEPATIQLVQRFHSALGLQGLALPAARPDPLAESLDLRATSPDRRSDPRAVSGAIGCGPEKFGLQGAIKADETLAGAGER